MVLDDVLLVRVVVVVLLVRVAVRLVSVVVVSLQLVRSEEPASRGHCGLVIAVRVHCVHIEVMIALREQVCQESSGLRPNISDV